MDSSNYLRIKVNNLDMKCGMYFKYKILTVVLKFLYFLYVNKKMHYLLILAGQNCTRRTYGTIIRPKPSDPCVTCQCTVSNLFSVFRQVNYINPVFSYHHAQER